MRPARAALLAGVAVALVVTDGSPSAQSGARPFTPDVERFVEAYLEAGGDKLTSWVQGDTTSRPDEALRAFRPIAGLTLELVAAEPVIRQPVDLHFDERGRLWVVQYLQYPFPAGVAVTWYDQYLRARHSAVPAAPPRHVHGADKITVLEDTNGDGVFESHRDVITGLNITTSVLTGRGGVWVMNPPYLLFYRDTTGDGLPDGDPEVRLEGFGLEDTHSLANSLTWGPDGWLYGVHGSTSTATVRGISFLGQAVWRYHPERDTFELFAEGGGNPWTLSFDSRGRAFSGDNGGNSRGFHWVPGGRYVKNFPKHGPFTHPYSYGHFSTMAHEGYAARFAMTELVYEEGRLPGYEGQLISGMALTSRMQASRLVPDGSTFRTIDTDAIVETADRSFRPVDTAVGPDGAVYIADWCDIRMDHTDPRDTWDKSCGRIWRLRASGTSTETMSGVVSTRPPTSFSALTSGALIELLGDGRKWYREQARRILGERGDRSVVPPLRQLVRERRGTLALEALWTAYQISGMDAAWALELVGHPDAPVRFWTVRLLDDRVVNPAVRDRLVQLAERDPDAEVRSELAGAMGRLAADRALPVLAALIRRGEDVADKHTPLRIWWAVESHLTRDADGVLDWLAKTGLWQTPLFTEHLASRVARRLAADRGDRPSFTRLDPDANWLAYAAYPRSRMPGGKGDYTEWATNDTPAIRDRNLTRLARLLELAPSALRDRLIAGVKAGLEEGPAVTSAPPALSAVIRRWWSEIPRPAVLVDVAARLRLPEAMTVTAAVGGGRGRGTTAGASAGTTSLERGAEGFVTHCAPCHQTDGSGLARLGAPLRNSSWVLGREDQLIRLVLHGLQGDLLMPPMGTLEDQAIADVLTYIRRAWGHQAAPVTPDTVAKVRAASAGRRTPWTSGELSEKLTPGVN